MKSFHMCLDIRGFLHNHSRQRDYAHLFKHDDGTPMSAHEAKDALFDALSKGYKVLPFGECDNFSYEDGCQGHECPQP